MEKESQNWCRECATNCCDHFVLENWSKEKLESLMKKYPFLKIYEHWQGEDKDDKTVDIWIMECERFLEDGSCLGYPENRPYFCEWAGERYKPVTGCKLFETNIKSNPDQSE